MLLAVASIEPNVGTVRGVPVANGWVEGGGIDCLSPSGSFMVPKLRPTQVYEMQQLDKVESNNLPGFELRGVLPPKPIAACCDDRLECCGAEGAGDWEREAAEEATEETLALGGPLAQADCCGSGTAVFADVEELLLILYNVEHIVVSIDTDGKRRLTIRTENSERVISKEIV